MFMPILKFLQKLLTRIGIYVYKKPAKFYYELENEIKNNLVKKAKGVLHIGAHFGQESSYYFQNGLKVIWVEALPDIFEKLQSDISRYENQIAFCALVGDRNVNNTDFFISNNNGSASSVYRISEKSNFTNVNNEKRIKLPMVRIDNLLSKIDMSLFTHWVLDVQGAELLVLQGAGDLILHCKSITVEVSSRETYVGGVNYVELKEYLSALSFFPLWEPMEDEHTDISFIRLY
jgi:FkbM family methyltransferase